MRQSQPHQPKRWVPTRLIEVDAWIDSSLWRFSHAFSAAWESLTIFSRRFRARGFKRVLVELSCEGLTLGLVGFVLLLVLAQPAMQLTANGLPLQSDYSVLFLDRHGNEIGRRGVLRSDAIPIDEMPDPFVKAVLEAFPGAVVGEIKTLAPSVEMPAIPDEPDGDDD